MKKTIVIAMVSAVCLSACGGAASSSQTSTASNSSESVKNESASSLTHESSVVESETLSVPETTSESGTEYVGYVEDGIYVIEECKTTEENLIVPDAINGAPVGIIEESAFMESEFKSIVLPNSVTYIGTCAFLNCQNLERIDLGTGLLSIGQSAFQACPKLATVTFPEGMTTFEGAPFRGNDNLGEVYVPSSVTDITRIGFTETCPNIIIVTPSGSKAEEVALAAGLPVKNV